MGDLGFASFDAQTRAFRLAREVLASRLRDDAEPDDEQSAAIARDVLPAIDRIGRGLGLTQRAHRLDPTTARALLRRAGVYARPESEAERRAAERERELIARRRTQPLDLSAGHALAAANHAQLVFAFIPRLPPPLVTWPRFRIGNGYADVSAPRGIGELVERVAEIESVLWRTAAGGSIDADERLRRTYAFCETACWLEVGLLKP